MKSTAISEKRVSDAEDKLEDFLLQLTQGKAEKFTCQAPG